MRVHSRRVWVVVIFFERVESAFSKDAGEESSLCFAPGQSAARSQGEQHKQALQNQKLTLNGQNDTMAGSCLRR